MLLVLRLVLVPILIAAVTLVARRWGPRAGGFITALPAVAGPTLGFYAVEQGRLFAADAARGSLLGLVGVAAFCLAYGRASTRLHWAPCLLVGWVSFAMVTLAIHRIDVGPFSVLLAAVAALFAARAMLPPPLPAPPAPSPPRWDLPVRMLSAAVLVFVLTAAAERLGSSVSGILTPFPVATAILSGFTHAQRGVPAGLHSRVVRLCDLLCRPRGHAAAPADWMVVCRGPGHAAGVADADLQRGSISASPLSRFNVTIVCAS